MGGQLDALLDLGIAVSPEAVSENLEMDGNRALELFEDLRDKGMVELVGDRYYAPTTRGGSGEAPWRMHATALRYE